MDYNYNRDHNNRKKPQRRVQSVQDMMNNTPSGGNHNNSSRSRSRSRNDYYEPPTIANGMDRLATPIFVGILALCVTISIVSYTRNVSTSNYRYPLNVATMNGVLNDIYENQGSYVSSDTTEGTVDNSMLGAASPDEEIKQTTSVTGAAMLLDAGGGVEGYTEAANYSELIAQLEGALTAGDSTFVGSKIGYTDDATGAVLGYPQSVVEHFTSFMAANPDKKTLFLESIQDADKFSGTSGTAVIVNIPLIKYKVTTDYDATTFSFSGFSEQCINSNQEATVAPMLPCMYVVTATCPSWAQPIEAQVEATFGENLEVNFGTN